MSQTKDQNKEQNKKTAQAITALVLTGALANMAMKHHDDFVDRNAGVASRAGLKCYIVRTEHGEGCPFCDDLAGEYEYEHRPDGIRARHKNCKCSSEFRVERKSGFRSGRSGTDRKARDVRVKADEAQTASQESREAGKVRRIAADMAQPERKTYDSLLSDVNRFYYAREQDALKTISDKVMYKIGALPTLTNKNILLDGSEVTLSGYDLKRILNKHGKQFDYSAFSLIKKIIESPECIALNPDYPKNSLLLYRHLPDANKSLMECAFIKKNDGVFIIHYQRISKRKIKKLLNEGLIVENHLLI